MSPPGASSPSAPEAWLSSSTPASPVEVPPSVGPSPHRLLSPVVVVAAASALTRRRAHHAWASARVKRWSVGVWGWGVVKAGAAWGAVGRVTAVHGHLHVHVVHVVHSRPVAQQTLVDCTVKTHDETAAQRRKHKNPKHDEKEAWGVYLEAVRSGLGSGSGFAAENPAAA